MLASLIEKLHTPVLDGTGLHRPLALFEAGRRRSGPRLTQYHRARTDQEGGTIP